MLLIIIISDNLYFIRYIYNSLTVYIYIYLLIMGGVVHKLNWDFYLKKY